MSASAPTRFEPAARVFAASACRCADPHETRPIRLGSAGARRPWRDRPRSGQERAPRTACAHVDTTREALVYEIGARHGFNPATAQGARRHSTRRPALVDYDTEADLEAILQNAEQLALFRQLGQKSWIIVPLVVRERVLGAMTLAITEIQTAL
jgi:hypothetical protein